MQEGSRKWCWAWDISYTSSYTTSFQIHTCASVRARLSAWFTERQYTTIRRGEVRKSIRTKSLSRSGVFRPKLAANVRAGNDRRNIARGVKSNRVLYGKFTLQCRGRGANQIFHRYDGIRSRSSKLEISLARSRVPLRFAEWLLLPSPPSSSSIHSNFPPLSSAKIVANCVLRNENLQIETRATARLHVSSLRNSSESETRAGFRFVFIGLGLNREPREINETKHTLIVVYLLITLETRFIIETLSICKFCRTFWIFWFIHLLIK